MADSARTITVKLLADTEDYTTKIEHAKQVTQELADLLASLGIKQEDVPAAVLGVLKLAS